MKMHFKAVELKYLDEETIKKIRIWRNQPFVKNMMYSQRDITEDEHINYITSLLADENRGLFVFYLDDNPFGVYQYEIHREGNYMMHGNYLVDQEYQDMGYGTIQDYFMNIIDFEYFHCNKNYGEILDLNQRALAIGKKTGDSLEGILRQHRLIDGDYHDVYCYGLLKKEWDEKRKHVERLIYKLVDEDYEIIL